PRSPLCCDILPADHSYIPPNGIFPNFAWPVSGLAFPFVNQGGIESNSAQGLEHSNLFDRIDVVNCIHRLLFQFVWYFHNFPPHIPICGPSFPFLCCRVSSRFHQDFLTTLSACSRIRAMK